jgi:hypothetical protein
LLVDLRDRILAIVPYMNCHLVDLFAALLAKPHETILFLGFSLAFEDNEPGVVRNPRRMGNSSWAEDHLSCMDNGHLVVTLGGNIMKVLLPPEL